MVSLSSSGGEGWGEEAMFSGPDFRGVPLVEALLGRLPLPEGEGWGEGEFSGLPARGFRGSMRDFIGEFSP